MLEKIIFLIVSKVPYTHKCLLFILDIQFNDRNINLKLIFKLKIVHNIGKQIYT